MLTGCESLSAGQDAERLPLPAELRHRAAAAQRRRVRSSAARRRGEEGGRAIAHQLHGSSTYPGENRTRVGPEPLSRFLE